MSKEKQDSIGNMSLSPYSIDIKGVRHYSPGITYRDWLIGKVLQGLCANPQLASRNISHDDISKEAINQIDNLLSKLDKELID